MRRRRISAYTVYLRKNRDALHGGAQGCVDGIFGLLLYGGQGEVMDERQWEAEIVRAMSEDGWPDIPKDGDNLGDCMLNILDYIFWLREKRQ